MKRKSDRELTIEDIGKKVKLLNGNINAANKRINRVKARADNPYEYDSSILAWNEDIVNTKQHEIDVLREAAHILAGRTYKVDF